jgi:acetyltransferase-like isoleucine patch superfamily enzyme
VYFFTFPSGMPIYGDRVSNCILGQGSKLYPQSTIHNGSKYKENITIGNNTHIAGNLTVWANAGKIEIGDWCFVGENSRIYSAKHIKIGNRVQIAHDCNIFDSNIHSLDPIERHKEYIQNTTNGLVKLFSMKEQEVIIEDDAWLGCGVVVLKGVTIGRCAIVGAGSVVTKDVPDYAVAMGNPARVVRILEFDRLGTKPEDVATEGSRMHQGKT